MNLGPFRFLQATDAATSCRHQHGTTIFSRAVCYDSAVEPQSHAAPVARHPGEAARDRHALLAARQPDRPRRCARQPALARQAHRRAAASRADIPPHHPCRRHQDAAPQRADPPPSDAGAQADLLGIRMAAQTTRWHAPPRHAAQHPAGIVARPDHDRGNTGDAA